MQLCFRRVVWAAVLLLLSSAESSAQSKPDRIRIGYAARAVAHSVPFVAREAGFFAEEGIEAEIVRTAGSIAPMALVANEVDLAIMSAYLMIPVAAQNKDVVMLGGFSRYASMVFVARPDVKSAQDLKGKIVGIQRPGMPTRKARGLPCGIWGWMRIKTCNCWRWEPMTSCGARFRPAEFRRPFFHRPARSSRARRE